MYVKDVKDEEVTVNRFRHFGIDKRRPLKHLLYFDTLDVPG